MTLDEAIKHSLEVVKSNTCTECKSDHKQLADWLKELKQLKETSIIQGINTYKPCPKCKSVDYLIVRNYDPIWRDGEVWCSECNEYVRSYDAG